MVKAKEFWEYICNELNYRFFAGIQCKGLKPLYNSMSSKFMHYIPAVDERVAVGLVTGARLSGVRGGVLMHGRNILDVINLIISFNKEYKIPILLICYDGDYNWANQNTVSSLLLANFKIVNLDDDLDDGNTFKDNLDVVIEGIEKENKSGIFFIGKGNLK